MYGDKAIIMSKTWWALVVTIQVILGSIYFMWIRKSKKTYKSICGKDSIQWYPFTLVENKETVEEPPVMGKIDENILNVGTTSFLCFHKEESIIDNAIKALYKYGVGTCGPRVFYGTMEIHVELEKRISQFMEVADTCMYSYGFSTVASAVPAYAKRGDIFFADECVWFAIQKGLDAARSTVKYFKHNDLDNLERQLSEAARKKELNPKRRAFLIAEAIYLNTGEMCPLKRLVVLARQYKLRIILDESLSIGVLGKHGRGLTEHLMVPRDDIDLIIGSLEHTFASVGGFCSGSNYMVEHQRIGGLGYAFSASLPPMLAQAALSALDVLEKQPSILEDLQENCKKLNLALSKLKHYKYRGDALSPIKHVYLRSTELTDRLKHSYLRDVTTYCLTRGVAFTLAAYVWDSERDCPEPSIRLAACTKLNDDNIALICSLLDEAYEAVGPKPDLVFVPSNK